MAIRIRSRTRSLFLTAASASRHAATARAATPPSTVRTPTSSSSSRFRMMSPRRFALASLLAFVMLTRPLHAQEQSQTTSAPTAPSPEENAGARVHGSADVGYRFTDIDGSEATYRQLFNLFDGPRLFGLELNATS